MIINSGFPTGVAPHSGTWGVWLGGDYLDTSYIQQQVTVPASSPYLAYYHWIASADTCGHDFASIRINGTEVDGYNLCDALDTYGWVKHIVNLSAYASQSVLLQFRVQTNNTLNSNLFLDDVGFQASLLTLEKESPIQINPEQALPRSAFYNKQ